MWFKSGTRNILFFLILLAAFALLGYYAFDWWQMRQKRVQLFEYFRKNSVVTQMLPSDTFLYINFFDLKRIHSDVQGTRFYDAFAHWIDTGMNGNGSANPLLGGMLEKTILNLTGEELGVALVPSKQRGIDAVVVARLSEGSDFIMRLALAQNKKWKRIRIADETVYIMPVKSTSYPEIYVHVNSDFAFASTDVERIRSMMKKDQRGPAFLQSIESHAVPEDTFVFAQSQNPRAGFLIHGSHQNYTMTVTESPDLQSQFTELPDDHGSALTVNTNLPELFQQPSISYALKLDSGLPQSSMLLTFPKTALAQQYEYELLKRWNGKGAIPSPTRISNANCFNLDEQLTLCSRESNLLLAKGFFRPDEVLKPLNSPSDSIQPLTFEIELDEAALSPYLKKIEDGDWTNFATERALYFLSCIKKVEGNIGKSSNNLNVSIH